MKKIILITLLFFLYSNCFSQDKTIDKILDNTKGVLDIINSTKNKKNDKEEKKETPENKKTDIQTFGKFIISNNSNRRITVVVSILSETNSYSKKFVLSTGDKEIFKTLENGHYEYKAIFEDGTIAKNGEFEISDDNKTVEKEVK